MFSVLFIFIIGFVIFLGIIQFTQHIVALEREDPVIADLHSQVRANFLPPVSIATDASL